MAVSNATFLVMLGGFAAPPPPPPVFTGAGGHFALDHFTVEHCAPQHFNGVVRLVDLQPCDPVVVDGGRAIGVAAGGSHFPFIAPSVDVRGLLAEAYVAHERDVRLPLSLSWMYGFDKAFCYEDASSSSSAGSSSSGESSAEPPPEPPPPPPPLAYEPTHEVDVRITDADGQLVFDSTTANYFASRNWEGRLRLHEWRTETAVCRIIQHTAVDDPDELRVIPAEIIPEDGRLDERCGHRMHRRVFGIGTSESRLRLAGNGDFVSGYNIRIRTEEARRGLRRVTRLTFSAEPGDGLGRFPGCLEPDLTIRTINRVTPDDAGNFVVGADECYYARQPSTIVGSEAIALPAALQLGNDCGPCFDCADFADVQKGVLHVWDLLALTNARRQVAQAQHAQNIARWLEEKECRESQSVRIDALPHHDTKVEVSVGVCNHANFCATNVILRVELAATAPFVVDPRSIFVTDPVFGVAQVSPLPRTPMYGGTRAYDFYFDAIPSQSIATVQFTANVPETGGAVQVTAIGRASILHNGVQPPPVSKTVEL